MKLKKCFSCTNEEESLIKKTLGFLYTLKNNCPKCDKKTNDAHYKFIRIVSSAESRT